MIPTRRLQEGEGRAEAVSCGRRLAAWAIRRFGNNPFRLAADMGWRVVCEAEDAPHFPTARLAVWEGDTRTIRLFMQPVRRQFLQEDFGVRFTCCHEIFHGLYACAGGLDTPPAPALNLREQEQAAEAFARALMFA